MNLLSFLVTSVLCADYCFYVFYVLAEPVPLKTLENYLCEGPFDSNGYARENWPGVIEVKALDTKRAHEKPERAGGDGGQDFVR